VGPISDPRTPCACAHLAQELQTARARATAWSAYARALRAFVPEDTEGGEALTRLYLEALVADGGPEGEAAAQRLAALAARRLYLFRVDGGDLYLAHEAAEASRLWGVDVGYGDAAADDAEQVLEDPLTLEPGGFERTDRRITPHGGPITKTLTEWTAAGREPGIFWEADR
jgi:hypothetical protein